MEPGFARRRRRRPRPPRRARRRPKRRRCPRSEFKSSWQCRGTDRRVDVADLSADAVPPPETSDDATGVTLGALAALCGPWAIAGAGGMRAIRQAAAVLEPILRAAQAHDVLGLATDSMPAGPLPDEVLEAIDLCLHGMRIDASRAEAQLDEVLQHLAACDIPVRMMFCCGLRSRRPCRVGRIT